jgi:hypothetical protein
MTTTADLAAALHDLLYVDDDLGLDVPVRDVCSFAEAGVLTSNDGLVLSLADGTEFQLTIVQSR